MSSTCPARKVILVHHFVGKPKHSDLKIVDDVPPCEANFGDGDFLVNLQWVSIDPYMRPYSRQLKEGSVMMAVGIGRVIYSKNAQFPQNSIVKGPFGWRTHALSNGFGVSILADNGNHPLSYYLGVLGTTGLTAYFGITHVCQVTEGDRVMVNAAAGAVGLIAGQIAKLKGCHIAGSTGSDAKVKHLKQRGFDAAFNYKSCDSIGHALQLACPKGIDCFFDNVGGHFFDAAMRLMNSRGRVALSGAMSVYNNDDGTSQTGPYIHDAVISKDLKVEGFTVARFNNQFPDAIKELGSWIEEGKIIADEYIVKGFENIIAAFIALFDGENTGKVIVSVRGNERMSTESEQIP